MKQALGAALVSVGIGVFIGVVEVATVEAYYYLRPPEPDCPRLLKSASPEPEEDDAKAPTKPGSATL